MKLTLQRLKDVLSYSPETGEFIWVKGLSKNVKPGRVAGTINGWGYHQIRIDGVIYRSNRLAWFYIYREWPAGEVDHINRNRIDNRICNLRVVDSAQNKHNSGVRKDNKSGVPGVFWNKSSNKWQVDMERYGKITRLGSYIDWFDAVCARKSAEDRYLREKYGK